LKTKRGEPQKDLPPQTPAMKTPEKPGGYANNREIYKIKGYDDDE
jgi:hypothetical protein